MILEFGKSQTITSLEKFKFEGKSLNNQDLMSSLEMLKQVNHHGSYRYLTHTTDKAMMERKTRHEVQELLVAEYETDGV